MELAGKKALVVGLGKSGVAAARFLAKKGARVTVNDMKPVAELKEAMEELKDLDLKKVFGDHPDEIFTAADLVVTSPGVPGDLACFKLAEKAGIPVMSELEMASRFVSAPIVAVTGTNGKTTVTHLLGEIFKKKYRDSIFVGGNIGNPLTELVLDERRVDIIICEVSSFQLEFINTFHPRVAVMLNISDDHLDRYSGRNEYADIKSWIFKFQEPDDFAVLNARDPLVKTMARKIRSKIIWFGDENQKPAVFMRANEMIFIGAKGGETKIPVQGFKLPGEHNIENLLAASAASLAMEVPEAAIAEAAAEFKGLPHRVEFIRETSGVSYYNDSKGTNVGAVRRALETFSKPVIILMGGLAKGCRFEELKPVMQGRVKAIMAYGESREQIAAELESKNSYSIQVVENLENAVRMARERARPGDIVLLSPGCASFDQFRDYSHRGDTFRKIVQEL